MRNVTSKSSDPSNHPPKVLRRDRQEKLNPQVPWGCKKRSLHRVAQTWAVHRDTYGRNESPQWRKLAVTDDHLFEIFMSCALAIGGRYYSQRLKRADDETTRLLTRLDELENRLRTLERESVTHEDLMRIESKMDDQFRHITDRLERLLERGKWDTYHRF